MIIEIRHPEEFEQYVSSGLVLVDFNAVWCGPCRMLHPVLEQLDKEGTFQDLKILSVDVDKVPQISARFGIQLIPTLFLYNNGMRINTAQGYKSLPDLKSFISNSLK